MNYMRSVAPASTRTYKQRGDRTHRPAAQLRAAHVRERGLRLRPRERRRQSGDNAPPLNATPTLHHPLTTAQTSGRVGHHARYEPARRGTQAPKALLHKGCRYAARTKGTKT